MNTCRWTVLAAILFIASARAVEPTTEPDQSADDAPDYVFSIRFTPEIAKGIGHVILREDPVKEWDLGTEQREQLADAIARRAMKLAHANTEVGRESFEKLAEYMLKHEGRERDESMDEWARAAGPLMPIVREFVDGIADDARQIVPAYRRALVDDWQDQTDFMLDGYSATLERLRNGEQRPDDNINFDSPVHVSPEQRKAFERRSAQRRAESDLHWYGETQWRLYVDRAGRYYNFDAEQKQKAESILHEIEQKAGTVRNRDWWTNLAMNRVNFHLMQKSLDNWKDTPIAWGIQWEFHDLIDPIDELTRELQDRLDALARPEQRAIADKRVGDILASYGLND